MRIRRRSETPAADREFVGTGVFWSFVVALLIGAALIVFVAQNTNDVKVKWTVWHVTAPLVVVVLVAMLAAVVLQALAGLVWRRRRRGMMQARHDAQRLRELAEDALSGKAAAPEPGVEEPADTGPRAELQPSAEPASPASEPAAEDEASR